eukprot:scaffold57_cov254-Pinguiococcus_pyrenoidosus.AAC.54
MLLNSRSSLIFCSRSVWLASSSRTPTASVSTRDKLSISFSSVATPSSNSDTSSKSAVTCSSASTFSWVRSVTSDWRRVPLPLIRRPAPPKVAPVHSLETEGCIATPSQVLRQTARLPPPKHRLHELSASESSIPDLSHAMPREASPDKALKHQSGSMLGAHLLVLESCETSAPVPLQHLSSPEQSKPC